MNGYQNTRNPLLEMEDLLLRKSPEQLSVAERAVLLNALGGEAQILAYRNMLLLNVKAMQPAAMPQLTPDPAIKGRLQKRFAQKHAREQKNGFAAFVWAALDLFTFQNPAQSGVAMAMLLVSLWFGSNFDSRNISSGTSITDTIKAVETPFAYDTAASLPADSNMGKFAPESGIAPPAAKAIKNEEL